MADPHPSPRENYTFRENNIEGWSSFILKRIWSLWGHMARGGAEVNSMVTWKNMHFWRVQLPRRQRVTHASRFNPEADVERAIEAVAGTNWGMLLKTDTSGSSFRQFSWRNLTSRGRPGSNYPYKITFHLTGAAHLPKVHSQQNDGPT